MDEIIRPMSRRRFLKTAGTALAATSFMSGLKLGPLTLAEAQAEAARAGEDVVGTWCAMCGPSGNCAIYAFSRNGVMTRVAGMKEAPHNKGALCCKAHGSVQWLYSPERIQKPLIRIGAKGEGKFKEVTWNEAVKHVADKLMEQKAKYGPESMGILSPARRDYSDYLYRFLMLHGSPNYGHSGICAMQISFIMNYTLGVRPQNDYANADVILIWGKQPVFQGPPLTGPSVVTAYKRGARIFAIKPTLEIDGAYATDWVPVRPGCDSALGLGMLHVICRDNLIDQEFVNEMCYGYEQLAEHVKQFTPQWAEEKCGVPAAQIEELARVYATTPKATIDFGNGLEHSPSSSDALRSIAIMMAITGHLDKPGGNPVRGVPSEMPSLGTVHLKDRYTQEWVEKLVGPEFPREFQPYSEGTSAAYYRLFQDAASDNPTIRTIIAPGTQPLVSTRNARKCIEAMQKLEMYVVASTHRTSDINYADVVIPCLTPYEIDHPFQSRGPMLMARQQVVEPVTEGKSMQQFMADLAVACGYGDEYWNSDMDACQNDLLARTRMTIDDLRKLPTGIIYPPMERVWGGVADIFKGRSPRMDKSTWLAEGKAALYNTSFEAAGYRPLPDWTELPESPVSTPDLYAKYPLILSDYHTYIMFTAGWQREVPYLRELEPEPLLHIHPNTAKARGIAHGDWVIVEGKMGHMKVKAEYYPGMREDIVMMLHGWWQGNQELGIEDMPILDGGANVNAMYENTEAAFDPLVTAYSSQALVEVRKA